MALRKPCTRFMPATLFVEQRRTQRNRLAQPVSFYKRLPFAESHARNQEAHVLILFLFKILKRQVVKEKDEAGGFFSPLYP